MDWGDLAKLVGAVAPTLGRVLAGPAGGVAGELIATALGVGSTPDEINEKLKTVGDRDAFLRKLQFDHQADLARLSLLEEQLRLEAQVQTAAEINLTMRAEMKAEHWFYRSWRPTFGWVVGVGFASHLGVFLWLVLYRPRDIPVFVTAVSDMTTLWTFAFAVCGVYVYKRSEEKKARLTPPPLENSESTLW